MKENKRECTNEMVEMQDQLAALTTRLKDLETQVGQLGEQTPPDTTAVPQVLPVPYQPSRSPCLIRKRLISTVESGMIECAKTGSLMQSEL